jgi:hypothetical protein
MASRSILVPRQDYSRRATTPSPVFPEYFEVVNRSQELKLIDEKIFKALALWETYSDNHEVILFA